MHNRYWAIAQQRRLLAEPFPNNCWFHNSAWANMLHYYKKIEV
jgi:hypothetical protein